MCVCVYTNFLRSLYFGLLFDCIDAYMYIYTAIHFHNFIIFLPQSNYLSLLKRDVRKIMTFFGILSTKHTQNFRILT